MTKTQTARLNNIKAKTSFINNIGKLSKGRKATWKVTDPTDGSTVKLATVECTSKGERPRKFRIYSQRFNPKAGDWKSTMGYGDGYTLRTVVENALAFQSYWYE